MVSLAMVSAVAEDAGEGQGEVPRRGEEGRLTMAAFMDKEHWDSETGGKWVYFERCEWVCSA